LKGDRLEDAELINEIHKVIHSATGTVHTRLDAMSEKIDELAEKVSEKADLDCVIKIKNNVTRNTTNIQWLIRILMGASATGGGGVLVSKLMGLW